MGSQVTYRAFLNIDIVRSKKKEVPVAVLITSDWFVSNIEYCIKGLLLWLYDYVNVKGENRPTRMALEAKCIFRRYKDDGTFVIATTNW
jgi:hypothetical protein